MNSLETNKMWSGLCVEFIQENPIIEKKESLNNAIALFVSCIAATTTLENKKHYPKKGYVVQVGGKKYLMYTFPTYSEAVCSKAMKKMTSSLPNGMVVIKARCMNDQVSHTKSVKKHVDELNETIQNTADDLLIRSVTGKDIEPLSPSTPEEMKKFKVVAGGLQERNIVKELLKKVGEITRKKTGPVIYLINKNENTVSCVYELID